MARTPRARSIVARPRFIPISTQVRTVSCSSECHHAQVPTIATIGVYGFSADDFLARLLEAQVSLVLDVRQRRGVRGTEYAWANSQRLQSALADAGIAYSHHAEL